MKMPTVVSLFAGCGGSSLGYRMAGYRDLLTLDFDKWACETLRKNFPETIVWQRDIKDVTGGQIMTATGLRRGELDVLDGSPPCQGFSLSGLRKDDDPRSQLFRDFVRILRGMKPRVFVMENVGGMIVGKMKYIFREVYNTLQAQGYEMECRLLDAAAYGVPQHRKRLIFIGVRDDLRLLPVFPKREKRIVTVREAFTDCPVEKPGTIGPSTETFRMLSSLGQGESYEKKYKTPGKHFNYHRLALNSPARTVCRSNCSLVFHPVEDRLLSTREFARISSFPDDYQFAGGWAIRVGQIGNSVPPRFMWHIAKAIREGILEVADGSKVI